MEINFFMGITFLAWDLPTPETRIPFALLGRSRKPTASESPHPQLPLEGEIKLAIGQSICWAKFPQMFCRCSSGWTSCRERQQREVDRAPFLLPYRGRTSTPLGENQFATGSPPRGLDEVLMGAQAGSGGD